MKGIASTVQKREFLQGFLPAYHREFALGHGCAAQFVRETVFEHWTRKFPTTPLDTKKEQQIIHWFYNRKLTKRRTTEAQQKPPHSETWNQDIALPDWNQDIALRDWKEYVAFPDWNEGDFALPDLNADQGQQAVEEMFVPMDPLPPTVTESPPGTLPPTESRATLPEAVNNGLEARIEKLARDLDAIVQENPTFSFFIQMGGVLNGTLQHLHYSGTSQNGQHYPEYYANSRGDDTGAQLLYQDFQAYLIAQQECLGAYPQLSLVEDRAPIHLFRCALEVYLAKTWAHANPRLDMDWNSIESNPSACVNLALFAGLQVKRPSLYSDQEILFLYNHLRLLQSPTSVNRIRFHWYVSAGPSLQGANGNQGGEDSQSQTTAQGKQSITAVAADLPENKYQNTQLPATKKVQFAQKLQHEHQGTVVSPQKYDNRVKISNSDACQEIRSKHLTALQSSGHIEASDVVGTTRRVVRTPSTPDSVSSARQLFPTNDWDDDLGSSDSSDSDTQPKPPSFKKLVAYHEPQSMLVVESGPLVTSFRLARRSSEKDTHNEFGDCDMLGEDSEDQFWGASGSFKYSRQQGNERGAVGTLSVGSAALDTLSPGRIDVEHTHMDALDTNSQALVHHSQSIGKSPILNLASDSDSPSPNSTSKWMVLFTGNAAVPPTACQSDKAQGSGQNEIIFQKLFGTAEGHTELPTASASAIIADSLDPITQYQETEHNGIVDYQGAGNAPDRNWPKIMSVPNGAPSTPANSYQRPQRLRRPPSISIREGRSFITPGARQEAANAQERHQKKASNHSRRAKRKKY